MEETNPTNPSPTPAPASPGKFNTHKVFAAIGIILTVTILILAGLWWYFWGQVSDQVEENNAVKVTTSSAHPATNSATTSAH